MINKSGYTHVNGDGGVGGVDSNGMSKNGVKVCTGTTVKAISNKSFITVDQLKAALPGKFRKGEFSEVINNINIDLNDDILWGNLRENILSYTSVLADGRYKIGDYINAVKYVSCKLLGSSNIQAFTKTFPDRYQRLIDNQLSGKEISCYVSAYNKNKMVNLILAQTLVPSHVLNADLYQKALNVQVELMMGANSEKVRCDAANSVLTQLKMPETTKIELDIGVKDNSAINDLKATTLELVAQQRKMLIANAMSAKDVAESGLIIDHVE